MKKILLILMSCGTLIITSSSISLHAQQTDEVIVEQIDEANSEMAADFEDDIFGYDFDVTDLDQDVKRTPPSKVSLLLQSYGIKLFLAGLFVKQYCIRALDYCLNNKFVNYLIADYKR